MTNQTIAKDTPLMEITLRRYEKPNQMNERELVRKLCLSFGLLQPGDSRDVIVDVFCVLLHNRKQKMDMTSEEVVSEVINYRKKNKLPLQGVASSNIRIQLRRLRELMVVDKIFNNYRIAEFGKLGDLFKEKIERFLLTAIIARVKEYIFLVDQHFLEGKSEIIKDAQHNQIANEETRHEGNALLN